MPDPPPLTPPSHSPAQPPAAQPVNPLRVSVDDLARMLAAAGGRPVTPDMVREDLEAGAPALPGGDRLNLVHYAAWLLREVQTR